MSDPAVAFFQTVVAQSTAACQVLVGNTTFLENVYTEFKPVEAAIGQTLDVVTPLSVTNNVVDIGTGPYVPNAISTTMTPIPFINHPTYCYQIQNFSQYNSPVVLRDVFVDPGIKGIAESVNAKIASLANPTVFNKYAPIASAASGVLQVSDATSARTALSAAKVPVRDFTNMFLTTGPAIYGGMLNNSNWTANSQVGFQLAGEIRRQALLGPQLGAVTAEDQAMPALVDSQLGGGTVTFTNGSTAITCTTSIFASLLPGQWIQLSSDVTNTLYQIKSVTNNNNAVLTTAYTGVTGTANAYVTSYTSLLYHRFAIALALRLLPMPDPQVTKAAVVFYKGLPILITLAYVHANAGWLLTFESAYGLAATRPEMGQLILS